MKKRILSIILVLCMICTLLPAAALAEPEVLYSGTCGDDLTWELDSEGTLTVSGTGDMYDYSGVNQPWYYHSESITSVVISNGVTSIGEQAFYDNFGGFIITSLTVPDSVTSIGDYAFACCRKLESVTLPEELTDIGQMAFDETPWQLSMGDFAVINGILIRYQSQDPDAAIPDSVRIIRDWTFGGERIQRITIPDSVQSISQNAFSAFGILTEINVDPDNQNYSSVDGVLFNKSKTELLAFPEGREGEYTVPGSVTSIGDYAFEKCTKLTGINIANSVTSIGDHAFENCFALTEVTIPGSVESIGEDAFNNCRKLASVSIENGVKTIEAYAFENCVALTSVTIPESVTSIGEAVFRNCSNLNEINVSPDNGHYSSVDGVLYNNNKTALLTYPLARYGAYSIPNTVSSISDYAFYLCKGLTKVNIPDSVKSIGNYAFANCIGLTKLTLPDSVSSIGDYAFASCEGLTGATIGNGVKSIGNNAFHGCRALTSLMIGKNVMSIGDSAFSGCEKLTKVKLPDSLTSIGNSAFNGCRSLTGISIPDSVTSVGDDAFMSCWSLISITIGKNVQSIGNRTFMSCRKLTSVTIPDGVTSIGNYAFDHCDQLTRVTVPDSVKSIGYSAFNYCTALTSLTLGNGVTSIGNSAFSNCHGLRSLVLPDSVTSIGEYVFSYSGVNDIVIPSGMKNIIGYTFYGSHIKNIYYTGTEEQWNELVIDEDGNEILSDVNIIFNSEPFHVHSYTANVTPPTCTEQGYTTYTCSCGDSYVDNYVPVKNHSYANGVCSDCGAMLTGGNNPFYDIVRGDFYYDAVMWAYQTKVTAGNGYDSQGNYIFDPDALCTRGQVVTFLWRLAGSPEPGLTESPFSDVVNEGECQYYYKAILWAVENGITLGNGDGTFGTFDPVSRAQLVTFLYRLAGEPETDGDLTVFSDYQDIESYFVAPMSWAVKNRVIQGYAEDNTCRPDEACFRWTVVLILSRVQDDTAKFIGTWIAWIDLTEDLTAAFEMSLGDSADYYKFGSFIAYMYYVFNADGTYSLTVGLSDDSLAALKETFRAGTRSYLIDYYTYVASQYGMTLNEFIREYNATPDEYGNYSTFEEDLAYAVEESLAKTDLDGIISEMFAAFNSAGRWKVSLGKLYTTADIGDEFDEGSYDTYTDLTGTSLTILDGFYDWELIPDAAGFYPAYFGRIA